MNTNLKISHLQNVDCKLRELQLTVEYWRTIYAEAGSQSVVAWRMYQDAVDNEDPRHVINSLFETAQLYDSICRNAWKELEEAKKNLLALHN